MSKKNLINAIEVKSPCSESWDEMQGNDQIRFCSHCAKDVNNLSGMTRKEALRLVRRSGGNLCIRYIKDPKTSRPIFSENLYKITRRATGPAAGVMTASISLSTAAYAQGSMTRPPLTLSHLQAGTSPAEKKSSSVEEKAKVTGNVTDDQGKALPGATVTLRDNATGGKETRITDGTGSYAFENIAAGEYTLTFTASGFETSSINDLSVKDGDVSRQITMKPGPIQESVTIVGGGMSVRLPEWRNPISRAVEDDDLEEVRNLITRQTDVNAKENDRAGLTPLFIAVENGSVEIAETLLRFGAKVNARNSARQTPLMMLDDDATADLVHLLVKYGARLNLVDGRGNTALILATDSDPDVSVIKALLAAGADVNLQNAEGDTALIKAANNDNLEAVRALLQAGADVNLKNAGGETAWDLSTDPEVTELIENYGGQSGDPEDADDQVDEPDSAPETTDSK